MIPRIIITGGSGFIGRPLCRQLAAAGYDVLVLTRQSPALASGDKITFVQWDGVHPGPWFEMLDGAYAVINLAGENISTGRWTEAKKRRILDSRLAAGEILTQAVQQARVKPGVFIQASAIGYYGHRADTILDEAAPPGTGFLAEVALQWEAVTSPVAALGVRRAVIRLGIVLGREGGILARLIPLFKMFAGGHPGPGRQWFSWIHIDDAVSAIQYILENSGLSGVFNLSGPNPVTAKEFCSALGETLHRPALMPIPALTLRLALGEMVDELLLASQRMIPKRLLDAGFTFRHSDLQPTLNQICHDSP